MVILEVRDVREGIDETHRAIEVFELELAANRARVRGELPRPGELAHELLRFGARKRRHASRVCSFFR
jgi:hypothetical protein